MPITPLGSRPERNVLAEVGITSRSAYYSLCRGRHNEYLRDTFAKLAAGWPQSRIGELLPEAWKPTTQSTTDDDVLVHGQR